MTNREKELRTKIGAECLHKGLKADYLAACSEKYDFVKCPDEFECLENEIKNFTVGCDKLVEEQTFSCDDCWKAFFEGETNE